MLIQFELRKIKLARPVLSDPVLDHRHFPGKGILCSVLLHETIFFALLLLPLYVAGLVNPPRLEVIGTINLRKPVDVVYFPVIPSVAPAPAVQHQLSGTEAGRKRVTYSGPQQIVSNFQEPTNFIQTILQPAIPKPAILKPPLLIPNILQTANAAPIPKIEAPIPPKEGIAPPKTEPAAKSIQPILPVKPETGAAIQSPKLVIPETLPPAALSKSVELLALTPIPAAPGQPPVIPEGEARGNFAISPTPDLAGPEKETAAGKSGKDPGANTEAGVEPVSGVKVSGGDSTTNRVSAPVADPFEGIIIVGGSGSTATARNAAPPSMVSIGSARPVASSYGGITVISTSASGGGLPHFDVFSNETIYTVYFDMTRTPNDGAPSWIFEFGVPPENNRGKTAAQMQQGLILPFPIFKPHPVFPAELVRKYLRQQIIVSAIIQTDGRMLQMSVKATPDAGLNEAVLAALRQWTFQPAQINGESVPMKVLVGIPIYQ
jgi:hypothetical protein